MNKDAKECFDTAAAMLQQAINSAGGRVDPYDPHYCQPSVAHDIVMQIALGAIRWNGQSDD